MTYDEIVRAVMSVQPPGTDPTSMEGVINDAWRNEQARQRATQTTYQSVLDGYNRGIYSVEEMARMANDGTLSSLPGFSQEHFNSVLGPAIAQGQAAQDSNFADLGMLSVIAAPLMAAAAPALSATLGTVGAGGTLGAVGGAATAAVTEQDILEGALTGGALGAAGAGLADYFDLGGLTATDLQSAGDGTVLPAFDAGGPGTLMPPAVPQEPTFMGTLTQTGDGVYENLGNIEAFGSTVPQALPGTPAAPPGSVDVLPASPAATVASPSEIGLETPPTIPNPSEIGLEEAAAAGGVTAAAGADGGSSGGGGGPGGGVAAGSALSRLLDGTATTADILSLLGTGAATGLGFIGSREQTQALERLANQYMELGAPSRARYEASFAPDFKPENIPGFTSAIDSSMDALLRKLSTHGNPYGNPGGLMEAQKYVTGNVALPAIQNYRAQNANTGGYSSFNTAAPSTSTAAIGSEANTFNVIGAGIADATRPRRPSLNDIFRSLV